jgi:hypothetical protein
VCGGCNLCRRLEQLGVSWRWPAMVLGWQLGERAEVGDSLQNGGVGD